MVPPKKAKAKTVMRRAKKNSAGKTRKVRIAPAAKAVHRKGKGARKAFRGTAERAAREALAAIKAAGEAIEAALPHSGDLTEEE